MFGESQELTFAKRARALPLGLTNKVERLKARRHIADGCCPILLSLCGTTHGLPAPELCSWRWCPDHPDADGEDQAYRDNEANEGHRKAVLFVVSNIRFPVACGPALHGFIIAGQRDAEGSWWGAGGLIIGAKRGSTVVAPEQQDRVTGWIGPR
jgi:hypothetical protein